MRAGTTTAHAAYDEAFAGFRWTTFAITEQFVACGGHLMATENNSSNSARKKRNNKENAIKQQCLNAIFWIIVFICILCTIKHNKVEKQSSL